MFRGVTSQRGGRSLLEQALARVPTGEDQPDAVVWARPIEPDSALRDLRTLRSDIAAAAARQFSHEVILPSRYHPNNVTSFAFTDNQDRQTIYGLNAGRFIGYKWWRRKSHPAESRDRRSQRRLYSQLEDLCFANYYCTYAIECVEELIVGPGPPLPVSLSKLLFAHKEALERWNRYRDAARVARDFAARGEVTRFDQKRNAELLDTALEIVGPGNVSQLVRYLNRNLPEGERQFSHKSVGKELKRRKNNRP
ncbi:hypothetical protein KOR34_37380 [Posidoniimonas corsicana]|uniref:Uncharacterized protein n=1 Tax=Posidoniimonas corsicana TaxID=1938618 RepID=A0A5C5V809_9BACT|nr:hypothetical protein KOR34_37380 [Posidoniimonas corsicana]